MELKRLDTILIKLLYLLAVGIVVTQTLGQENLTSAMFTMTFPLTVFIWMRTIRKAITRTDILMFVACIVAVVAVLLDAAFCNANLSFSYFKKVIMFMMTLLFFQSSFRLHVHKELVHFIDRVVDFLVCYLIVIYVLQPVRMFMLNGRLSGYLTFSMTNPNLTGMYMASLYMLQLMRVFRQGKLLSKLLHIGLSVILAFFTIQTQSRNALLAIVLFTLVFVWLVFRGIRNMYVSKLFAALVAWTPALFVVAYMLLVNTSWLNELLGFLVGEGKDLDSRVAIWTPALDALQRSPLIGSYNTISEGSGTSQMHNSHLDIASSYGIPVLVMVCMLLQRYLYQNGWRYKDKQGYLFILGFACILMLGIGEGAVFSGGLGIYIFAGSFLLMARWEGSERRS